MQNESKGVYVQMPKPDNDEAVKLLADLVEENRFNFPLSKSHNKAYIAAKKYLLNKFHSSLKVEEFTPSEATV